MNIKYISRIDVCVVSYGGAGTTVMMNFLSNYLTLNHPNNGDHLKHWNRPSAFLSDRSKILYIYGDPIAATTSLFRRGFHHSQPKAINKNILTRTNIPQQWDLDQYAKNGRDLLGLETHFKSHLEYNRCFETIFIKYEDFWNLQNLEMLFNLLGINANPTDFPKYRKRNSQSMEISSSTLSDLNSMYGNLTNAANKLSGIMHYPAQPDRLKSFKSRFLIPELTFHSAQAIRPITKALRIIK